MRTFQHKLGIFQFLIVLISFKPVYSQDYLNQENLRKHLTIIASDDFEGRNTGSLGQLKAARYIANAFQTSGVKPLVEASYGKSYYQDVPLKKAKIESVGFSTAKSKLTWGVDLSGISIYYPTEKELETVFAGFGIDSKEYSDFKDINVNGKLAIILWNEPKNKDGTYLLTGEEKNSAWGTRYGIYKKVKAARARGAEDVLVIMPSKAEFEARKQRLERYTSKSSFLLPDDQDFEGKKSKYGTLYTYPEAFAEAFSLNPKSFTKSIQAYYGGRKTPGNIPLNRQNKNRARIGGSGYFKCNWYDSRRGKKR